MTANIIDGNALAHAHRIRIEEEVKTLRKQGVTPCLAVILVGNNPASEVYVRHKVKDSEDVGFLSILKRLPESISESALLDAVIELNEDPSVHGILVQLPLPKHIDAQKVIATIAPAKDVDGFHVSNAGALMVGQKGFLPCTPLGCLKMIESIHYDLRGKHAVVIGRSNIVGKPMALMLLQKSATVTICHSATTDLKAQVSQADLIVAAVGKVNLVTEEMVKPGAVVIDVGMNRNAAGKLCGDVDFEGVKKRASWITPVPGGVGPMTRAMLLENTLQAARAKLSEQGR